MCFIHFRNYSPGWFEASGLAAEEIISSNLVAVSNSIANKEWFAVRITVVISIVPTATLGTRMTIISGFSAVVKRIPKSGMRIF